MFTNNKGMIAAFVFLLGVLVPLFSAAQGQLQRRSVEEHIRFLKDKIKLNDEQTKKITIILEDQREEMTTAVNDNRNDHQAMNAAVQEITKKADSKIKKILTEKQIKAYDRMIKDRQAKVSSQINDDIK